MANTQEPHSKIYKTQGATALVVSSGAQIQITSGGEINLGAGASANFTSGRVKMPGNLARGYSALVAVAAKTTATASGLITSFTTGTQPSLRTFEQASGALVFRWTSAAGLANPLYYAPWRVPDDLSTAEILKLHYTARASGNAATNQLNFVVRAGTATADIGTTGPVDYSATHAERTISIASGSVPASGLVNVTVFPTAASGTVSLFGLGISYGKKTS